MTLEEKKKLTVREVWNVAQGPGLAPIPKGTPIHVIWYGHEFDNCPCNKTKMTQIWNGVEVAWKNATPYGADVSERNGWEYRGMMGTPAYDNFFEDGENG